MVEIPPHDIDAEEAVIGSLLIDGTAIRLVRDTLKPEDFYSERNSLVYEACLSLYQRSEAINQITVAQELARRDKLEACGGAAILSHLISICPTSLDIESYSKIVAELSIRRQLITAGDVIAGLGYQAKADLVTDLDTATEAVDRVRREIKFLKSHIINPRSAAESMLGFLDDVRENKVAMSWGFLDIDAITTGIYPQDYIIIGSRPSVGKTQLLLQIAHNLANQGKIGLFVSLEMGLRAIQEREIAMECGISIWEMRRREISEDKWGDIVNLAGIVSERPLYYLTQDRTSAEVAIEARRLKGNIGLDFLVVDYIQLLRDCRGALSSNVTTHHLISNASKTLKAIAKELDIAVIVASQLNRELEYRENKRPRLADLKESGSLEEDADVVFLLYRDELYNPDTEDEGIMELKMAKNRQLGQAKAIKMQWLKSGHRYANSLASPELFDKEG
jgi:replicative DNA helicase